MGNISTFSNARLEQSRDPVRGSRAVQCSANLQTSAIGGTISPSHPEIEFAPSEVFRFGANLLFSLYGEESTSERCTVS